MRLDRPWRLPLAAGFRVPFLHWQLLGFVSLGLVLLGARTWRTAWRPIKPAVVLLAASLVPLTGLWPAAWAGRWTLVFAPVLAATAIVPPPTAARGRT